MCPVYQGRDESKKKFGVYKIETIPYKFFPNKLSKDTLGHVATEFDVESSSVHLVLYQTSEGKIRSVTVARISDLALSPVVESSSRISRAQVIANIPIVSDEEYSVLVDICACREANKLQCSYSNFRDIENRLKNRKIYDIDMSERIRSFLPLSLEERVSKEVELDEQIAPSILRCEKLQEVAA